ncbi:twin-arginine translocase subunit TatC [Salinibacterium sp. G-O1]|uniref:twin-arginine translocase subunit TatC n=1 Tax=Salinibacterium sp. G-O1 TaxID=3046208 RepID=UPI0024BB4C67|nr:twin-arginine translocase subunit TatC [Salinibacterium sp. G-O1]MDJ0335046.1 twin-arginine translocase subunit TatC [Salinibacterium sp. G-O1]
MSLGDHLRELRKRLVISAAAILVAAIVGFLLAPFVIDALRVPINQIAEDRNAQIIYTTVTGAFDLRIAIAITIAIVIASPVWLYQIFAFMVPGLTGKEKKYTFGFFFSAVPLFFAGAAAGWYLFPHMVELLTSFSSNEEATFLDAKVYYDFVIKLVLAIGIGFVLPVFLVLLNFVGVLSAQMILKGWRLAILAICIFTAIATPAADVISMFLLAIPMVVLYFAAALIAWVHDRRAARKAAVLEASLA